MADAGLLRANYQQDLDARRLADDREEIGDLFFRSGWGNIFVVTNVLYPILAYFVTIICHILYGEVHPEVRLPAWKRARHSGIFSPYRDCLSPGCSLIR